MRLDKFLKVSRIIKRRTIAKELCDAGRVQVNDRVAKSSTEVNPGDRICIGFGTRQRKVEVLKIAENVRADLARELYQELEGENG